MKLRYFADILFLEICLIEFNRNLIVVIEFDCNIITLVELNFNN